MIEFLNKNSIFTLKYAFKKYYYVITNLKFIFILDFEVIFICVNFEVEITFLNRIQRQKFFLNIKISKMISLIRVREFDSVIYNINEFVIIIMYANNELFNDILIVAKMIMKTHLIDNLKVNIIIDNDVFVSQKIKFDFINEKMIIDIY